MREVQQQSMYYRNALNAVATAARKLRITQKAYLVDRGNEALGKLVGEAAKELDQLLDKYGV